MKAFFKTFLFFIIFFQISFAENDVEFKFGVGTSKSNYNIKTQSNSILKWSDITVINYTLDTYYKPTDGVKLKLGVNYGTVISGVMIDDDLQNLPTLNCTSDNKSCSGAFSTTKEMKGRTFEVDLFAYNVIGLYQSSEFNFVAGLSYKDFFYKPKGLNQIAMGEKTELNKPQIFVSDVQTQHTNFKVFGPTLGFSFNGEMDYLSFDASLLGFISFYAQSSQTEWGYDWKIKEGMGKVFGIDFRLNMDVKLPKKDIWFGVGTGVNYMRGSNLTECGTDKSSNCYGSTKYLEHLKMGINLNLKFK